MVDVARRDILKLGALTPLLALFSKLEAAEVVLATPAEVELYGKERPASQGDHLRFFLRIADGKQTIGEWETTPFAGLEHNFFPMPTLQRGGVKYSLERFTFNPRVHALGPPSRARRA